MAELRFLKFLMNGKLYFCPENAIERVISVEGTHFFDSPFGPHTLKCLFQYNNMVLPLFAEREINFLEKVYNILIIKKIINLAGLVVEETKNFVVLDETIFDNAIATPSFLSKKAIMHEGKETFFLDIDALFNGQGVVNEKDTYCR